MKDTVIKNVLLNGTPSDILISEGRFAKIAAPAQINSENAANVMDGTGKAIIPALYNTHTHAAMTLMRGFADDMALEKWLTEYVWPFEDKLTDSDIRQGSEIAVKEMINSGSVFFNDMYFGIDQTIDIVAKSGMRAAIGVTVMENHSLAVENEKLDFIKNWSDPTGGRIQLVMAPHAVYTVGPAKLRRTAEFARNHGMRLHIHVAETAVEVQNCLKEHGMTPVRYLDSLGFLGPDVIAAHCVYVDREEWDILAGRGVTVSHCPCSNMKISSGRFPYELALSSGCRITLGTDGASSNNNLDLREEMKFAALLAKCVSAKNDGSLENGGNPELLPAVEVFRWASRNGALAFGIDGGEIAEGRVADALLIDLNNVRMRPCHNLISNFVYSADSDCIAATICDGRICGE
ncbi:MAG: amidohydrolase [Bacteroidales bacterium]|nr:amidohydrolase [Bacteroidales bacterium]